MNCRFCGAPLEHEFIDLVGAPPSNAFLSEEQINEPEVYYPLKLYLCTACFLVQIDEYKKSADIFDSGYVYFSSYSTTWLDHAKRYVDRMIQTFHYDRTSLVIEIASNDGYLLQYFKERGIPCLGIEPAAGTAAAARAKGIETLVDFFGLRIARELARRGRKADLLVGNNVLAHVPDLNDFVAGLKIALNPSGVITMEFPHLMQMIEQCQFDTIYHEHYSYLSFTTVRSVFTHHGLEIFDVEELPTHGGSLRIYAQHAGDPGRGMPERVAELLERERSKGLTTAAYYRDFRERACRIKYDLLKFLIEQKENGKCVMGYGAAAKGNTLLNYCGIRKDLLGAVVDASPHKQSKYLPGSHIAVVGEEAIRRCKPDFVLILPWNIKEEIMGQLDYIRAWGGRFVVPNPHVRVLP
jgi:SAM-dependent methyltransferase